MSMLVNEALHEVREMAGTYAPVEDGGEAVPAGFKRTEVGVIPTDWEQTTVRGIASPVKNAIVGGPFGSDLVSSDYVENGVPVIRGQNMGAPWVSGNFVFVSPQKARSLEANLARPSDLVFTQRGTLGQVSVVPCGQYDRYLISQSQMKLSVNRSIADSKFFYYLFTSKYHQSLIERETIQTGVPHINLGILRNFPVQLPALSEQRAIAVALSDVDALQAKLDQLIAKKRDLKQAAMQQLLTGKVRLPGFTGEWSLKYLGEISEISMGRTPSRLNPLFWGPGSVWLSIADMNCKVVSESKEEITALAAEGMSLVRAGTLLMSFKLSIGRLAFAGCDLYTNEAICAFGRLQANAEFLYYALQSVDFSLYGTQAVKGYTLNKQSLKLVEVKLPEPEEQEAIATIIYDMDAELSALEDRRAKTRELKQGMMQALLTGRIRLL